MIAKKWYPMAWDGYLAKQLSHVWLFYDPMDCSLPGSSIHGIFQARVLEWVAISFFRKNSQLCNVFIHLSPEAMGLENG